MVDGCLHHCASVECTAEKFGRRLRLSPEKALFFHFVNDAENMDTWNTFHSTKTETLPVETEQSLFLTWYRQQKQKKDDNLYFYLERRQYPCNKCCSWESKARVISLIKVIIIH